MNLLFFQLSFIIDKWLPFIDWLKVLYLLKLEEFIRCLSNQNKIVYDKVFAETKKYIKKIF